MKTKSMFGSLTCGDDTVIFNIHQIRTLTKRDMEGTAGNIYCIDMKMGNGVQESFAYPTREERNLNFERFLDLLVEF